MKNIIRVCQIFSLVFKQLAWIIIKIPDHTVNWRYLIIQKTGATIWDLIILRRPADGVSPPSLNKNTNYQQKKKKLQP